MAEQRSTEIIMDEGIKDLNTYIPGYFRIPVRIAVVLAGAWILAACEPSVDERVARSEQNFADAVAEKSRKPVSPGYRADGDRKCI